MFVIESTNAKGWRWISAVVQTQDEAQAQLDAIPAGSRAHHRIVANPASGFPVFLIESRGFEWGDLDFIRARLARTQPCGDEDRVHFNIYAFEGPFVPGKPGRDDMGRLLHWHVCDSTLVAPRAGVLDTELEGIAKR